MALRDYIPVHIYNSASAHLFGPEELKKAPTGPQLRPEYATLRAYAAGNIEVYARPVQPTKVPSLLDTIASVLDASVPCSCPYPAYIFG